jgi:heterodisulfide reductase subunit C/nitrate reductase gamma subunit
MTYAHAVYIALAIFGLGLAYKVSSWFRYRVGIEAEGISPTTRLAAAIRGIVLTILSRKIVTLLKVVALDVILQVRVLRRDRLRWIMHFSIFGGFMGLLLLHALGNYITAKIFSQYQPTLNPFLALRDLFGFLMIVGIGIAIYRRWILKRRRKFTNVQDSYAIAILAVIMISGVLLLGSKIISYTKYEEMVQEYTIQADEQDLKGLEAYWVKEYDLVSPNSREPFDAKTLERGKLMNEMSCLQCHSRPQWAFLSYVAAKVLRPVALPLDRAHVPVVLWHIHFLACVVGLAYLPFSKMFHLISSPISLLANAVMDRNRSEPANIATRQILELDACMHCGACTTRCAVGVIFEEIPNRNILPSEKIGTIKALAAGKKLNPRELGILQEGMYLCTNCYRCTVACPAGINLQDLWFSVRESLLRKGQGEFLVLSPFSLYRGLMSEALDETDYGEAPDRAREAAGDGSHIAVARKAALPLPVGEKDLLGSIGSSIQGNTFSHCYRCVTCSNACPVVRNYPAAVETLGLLPHQIMHAVGLRLWDLVFSAKMLWDCLGCYQCQEHCPQGVCVADVLYELKSLAIARAKEKLSSERQEG